MKNNCYILKNVLEKYFKKRIGIEDVNEKFDELLFYLDDQYKLSDIYDFDFNLVADKEHHNKFYRFEYNMNNPETTYDTTVYIYFIFNDTNSKNLGIMFDEITIGERDYPYGKTTIYLLDGTIVTRYYDYNDAVDVWKNDNYIKKLIKM